jgi:hypothetical protein
MRDSRCSGGSRTFRVLNEVSLSVLERVESRLDCVHFTVGSYCIFLPGDLKTFLLSRRQMVGQNTKEAEDVSAQGLTQMALDVAEGLQYLSELKYVHR